MPRFRRLSWASPGDIIILDNIGREGRLQVLLGSKMFELLDGRVDWRGLSSGFILLDNWAPYDLGGERFEFGVVAAVM